MTQKQINYLNMLQAVITCLKDNRHIWSAISPIADEVVKLQPVADRINAAHQEQTRQGTEGYTSNKELALDKMQALAYGIAIKVKAYARKAQDMVLFKAVDFSMTDLNHGPEKEQLANCKMIAENAAAQVSQLTAYGVTAADISALQAAIAAAEPLTAERDAVMGEHIESTISLNALFKEAREIFVSLDELIEALVPDTQQAFEDTYFATRRINDRRGGGGNNGTPTAG